MVGKSVSIGGQTSYPSDTTGQNTETVVITSANRPPPRKSALKESSRNVGSNNVTDTNQALKESLNQADKAHKAHKRAERMQNRSGSGSWGLRDRLRGRGKNNTGERNKGIGTATIDKMSDGDRDDKVTETWGGVSWKDVRETSKSAATQGFNIAADVAQAAKQHVPGILGSIGRTAKSGTRSAWDRITGNKSTDTQNTTTPVDEQKPSSEVTSPSAVNTATVPSTGVPADSPVVYRNQGTDLSFQPRSSRGTTIHKPALRQYPSQISGPPSNGWYNQPTRPTTMPVTYTSRNSAPYAYNQGASQSPSWAQEPRRDAERSATRIACLPQGTARTMTSDGQVIYSVLSDEKGQMNLTSDDSNFQSYLNKVRDAHRQLKENKAAFDNRLERSRSSPESSVSEGSGEYESSRSPTPYGNENEDDDHPESHGRWNESYWEEEHENRNRGPQTADSRSFWATPTRPPNAQFTPQRSAYTASRPTNASPPPSMTHNSQYSRQRWADRATPPSQYSYYPQSEAYGQPGTENPPLWSHGTPTAPVRPQRNYDTNSPTTTAGFKTPSAYGNPNRDQFQRYTQGSTSRPPSDSHPESDAIFHKPGRGPAQYRTPRPPSYVPENAPSQKSAPPSTAPTTNPQESSWSNPFSWWSRSAGNPPQSRPDAAHPSSSSTPRSVSSTTQGPTASSATPTPILTSLPPQTLKSRRSWNPKSWLPGNSRTVDSEEDKRPQTDEEKDAHDSDNFSKERHKQKANLRSRERASETNISSVLSNTTAADGTITSSLPSGRPGKKSQAEMDAINARWNAMY